MQDLSKSRTDKVKHHDSAPVQGKKKGNYIFNIINNLQQQPLDLNVMEGPD